MMDKNSWLVAHFHNGFSYWIYGCMGILAALFMWKFVPETKGKTLEELEELWEPTAENTARVCAVINVNNTPQPNAACYFYSRFNRLELHSHSVITSSRIAAE